MKPPPAELLALCGALRDETATPEQIARLEHLLASDPEARRFYRQFSQISATLERYEQLHAPGESAASSAPVHAQPPRPATYWLALAACVALLAAAYFRFTRGTPEIATNAAATPNPAPVALVHDSHYCTVIPRMGPAVALNEAYQLREGDIIATAPNGSAFLRFTEENTMFILASDTRAWLSREGGTKIIHLSSGQLYGDVAAQRKGAQWRILTSDGEARVLGTQLAVSALSSGTRVAVSSGVVRVTARDSRQSIETPAGFAAELTPTTARLVKLAPTEPTRVAMFTVIDADTNQPLVQLTEGAVLDLAALPTRRINIEANCEPKLVGAVRFTLVGVDAGGSPLKLEAPQPEAGWSRGRFPEQIENFYPYMLAGDPAAAGQPLPGHSYAWTPPAGHYTLTAVPYAVMKNAGARGDALTIHFEITDSAAGK